MDESKDDALLSAKDIDGVLLLRDGMKDTVLIKLWTSSGQMWSWFDKKSLLEFMTKYLEDKGKESNDTI